MIDSNRAACICAVLIAGICAASHAQQVRDFPSRPIRLVVPYAPGGSMDLIGHNLGQKLAASLGQNLFIDNRAGAGGAIGTDVVAKAAPDGYTMLLTSSSHATLPSVARSLPYDPVKDFAPITMLARSVGSLLTVHPSVPAHSLREFIALARAHPGKLNYGSAGVGNLMQFAAESFSLAAGIRMTHVPYKGSGQVIIDLLAGRIELAVITAAVVVGHIRAGKLRALAISAQARWSELADVPTMDEAGLKGFSYVPWYGLWYPAGTPAEIVARVHGDVVRALEDPVLKHKFAAEGMAVVASTPQAFGKAIVDDIELHRRLAARIGIQPQ